MRSATVAPELLVELAAHPHEWPWDEAQMGATRAPQPGHSLPHGLPDRWAPGPDDNPQVSRFSLLVVLEMP